MLILIHDTLWSTAEAETIQRIKALQTGGHTVFMYSNIQQSGKSQGVESVVGSVLPLIAKRRDSTLNDEAQRLVDALSARGWDNRIVVLDLVGRSPFAFTNLSNEPRVYSEYDDFFKIEKLSPVPLQGSCQAFFELPPPIQIAPAVDVRPPIPPIWVPDELRRKVKIIAPTEPSPQNRQPTWYWWKSSTAVVIDDQAAIIENESPCLERKRWIEDHRQQINTEYLFKLDDGTYYGSFVRQKVQELNGIIEDKLSLYANGPYAGKSDDDVKHELAALESLRTVLIDLEYEPVPVSDGADTNPANFIALLTAKVNDVKSQHQAGFGKHGRLAFWSIGRANSKAEKFSRKLIESVNSFEQEALPIKITVTYFASVGSAVMQ